MLIGEKRTQTSKDQLICMITQKIISHAHYGDPYFDFMEQYNNNVYMSPYFGKPTIAIDTKTEIHLLPVRDRHTHALSRNTKH